MRRIGSAARDAERSVMSVWQDNERIVRRAWRYDPDWGRHAILVVISAVERPAS